MKTIAIILVIFGALAIAGQMDFDDAQTEQEHYCEMVKMKAWPDYQGTYKKYCR